MIAFRDATARELGIDLLVHIDQKGLARDPKGLYAKAREGRVRNVTGLDSPDELPEEPELHLITTDVTAEELADQVIEELDRRGAIGR